MKVQSLAALQAHLLKGDLAPVYWVMLSSDGDRLCILEEIAAAVRLRDPGSVFCRLKGESHSLDNALAELRAPSFFSTSSLVLYDGMEKLDKRGKEALGAYLQNPFAHTYLLLGSPTASPFASLNKGASVILDLSAEKPWDRDLRVKEWLVRRARLAGKTLAPEAAAYLVEQNAGDMAAAGQELDKLLCFAESAPAIGLKECKLLCASTAALSGWQIADALVWGQGTKEAVQDLFALIGQVRFQLEQGYQLALCSSREEAQARLPQAKPKHWAAARGRELFFKQGLLLLFKLELACKNSAGSPKALWERFTAQLERLR
jgi:DNA polymerase III delta subunit